MTVKAFTLVILKVKFEINAYYLSFCVDLLLNPFQRGDSMLVYIFFA